MALGFWSINWTSYCRHIVVQGNLSGCFSTNLSNAPGVAFVIRKNSWFWFVRDRFHPAHRPNADEAANETV